MKASEGEKIRLDHQIDNLQGLIHGLEESYRHGWPSTESAQAIADAAARLLTHAARYDAFRQVELQGDEKIAELQERIDGTCERCQERCTHAERCGNAET